MANPTKTALIVMPEGVEEIEAITPIDLLRRAGVQVTVASLSPEPRVTGRTGIVIGTDTSLASVGMQSFDLLIIPGGPGVRHLRASPLVRDLVKHHVATGRLVAAICAAPTVLKDAGALESVPYTAHFSVENELPEMRKDVAVVRHGHIITSRGAGTAVPFALTLITALFDEAAAQKVAEAICYPN
jgi:4-methyl-5(b-hydroxyethyl)-thiazole monophosphate biosynthesis